MVQPPDWRRIALLPLVVALLLLLGVPLLSRLHRRSPATVELHDVPAGYVVDVRADSKPPPPGGWQVPAEPFKGQVRPTEGRCPDPDDVVLSGGCWARLAKKPHPVTGCGERYYRRGDACYAPVMRAPRVPTSLSR